MKVCTKCSVEKNLSEFNNSKRGKFQKRGECKTCQSEIARARNKITYDSKVKWKWNMKSTFNLTIEDYNIIFNKHNGSCAICKRHQTEFKKRLAIDHCHKTNEIRGLLCSSCNTAIGLFKDDIDSLSSAIDYLKGRTAKKPK